MLISFAPFRQAAAASLLLLAAAACDDPATLAKDVVGARGNCSEDSLRVSSETCVQMFQTYAEMATKAIKTYIGGMKAMDQALKRMPPANFDTAGLGHAFTPTLDSTTAALASRTGGTALPGGPSFSRSAVASAYQSASRGGQWSQGAPDDWGDPYSPYDPYGRSDPYDPGDGDPYGRATPYPSSDPYSGPGSYGPPGLYGANGGYGSSPYGAGSYGSRPAYGPDNRSPRDPRGDYEYELPDHPAPPTSPPGVLRPPSERLDRPWVPRRGQSGSTADPRYYPAPPLAPSLQDTLPRARR